MDDEIRQIYRVLKKNEDIARTFFEIESEILTIFNYRDFFRRLLGLVRVRFNIPHVWLTVISPGPLAEPLQAMAAAEEFSGLVNFISPDDYLAITGDPEAMLLENRAMGRFSPLVPKGADFDLGSLAVAPLSLDGKPAGSLNLADPDPNRYKPDMQTLFLAQLSVKISLCLSNVTAHEKLLMLAIRDPLTRLYNRGALQAKLKKEFSRARRYGSPLSLAFIDLDGFKDINDTFGHDQGDAMLVYFAKHLKRMVRDTDTASRLAGDEFVVLLPETEADHARQFMERLRTFFRDNPAPIGDEQRLAVRFSCGVADTTDPGLTSPGLLLKQSDVLLYEDKARRKNGK